MVGSDNESRFPPVRTTIEERMNLNDKKKTDRPVYIHVLMLLDWMIKHGYRKLKERAGQLDEWQYWTHEPRNGE